MKASRIFYAGLGGLMALPAYSILIGILGTIDAVIAYQFYIEWAQNYNIILIIDLNFLIESCIANNFNIYMPILVYELLPVCMLIGGTCCE